MDEQQAAKHKMFFVSHSMAIVIWQHVETDLFFLFARLIRSQNPIAMTNMYHSIINFQLRLSMVDAAMRGTLQDRKELLGEWDGLHRRLKKQSSRRNDLVHFALFCAKNENAPEETREPSLHSSVFDLRGIKPREYTTKQISETTAAFAALSSDLQLFQEKLSRVVKPPSLRKRRVAKSRELFE